MPGTLTLSTLSDGTNSTNATDVVFGSARAWVNFNGTTSPGTIRASYNVSSITKNATGDYTVNFTNALSDANYSFCFISDSPQSFVSTGGGSASSIRIYTRNASSVLQDSNPINAAAFR